VGVFHLGALAKESVGLVEKEDGVAALRFAKNALQVLFCLADVFADDGGEVNFV